MPLFRKKKISIFKSNRISQKAKKDRKAKVWKSKEGGRKKTASFIRHFKTKRFKMLLVAILVVVVLLYLALSPVLQVNNIIITSSNQDINKSLIREFIEPKIMKSNIVTIPKAHLKELIYQEFEDVSQVKISRKPLHTVEIEVKGFPIVAVIKHRGKRYYINKSGVVIPFDDRNLALPFFEFILTPVEEDELRETIAAEKPVTQEESLSTLILNDRLAKEEEVKPEPEELTIIGRKLVKEEELALILDAIELVEENFNFKITFAKYIQIAKELHLATNKNFTILLDAHADPVKQLKKLKKAQEVVNFDNLERIDLSIEGKRIYYVERPTE